MREPQVLIPGQELGLTSLLLMFGWVEEEKRRREGQHKSYTKGAEQKLSRSLGSEVSNYGVNREREREKLNTRQWEGVEDIKP